MNLAFNFNDELFWIHNFLPKKLYEKMYIEYIKNIKNLNFKKTIVNWNTFNGEPENMSESFGQTKEKEDVDKINFFLKEYHILLRHQKFVSLINSEFSSHLRKWKYMEHLTWHNDAYHESAERNYAATYYFNKTWKESWGGELMFKSSNGSGFIPVKGNSIVIIKAGLKHKVNPNLNKNYPRLSVQTWII